MNLFSRAMGYLDACMHRGFLLLFVLMLFALWPGVMRVDSLNQLAQAQAGVFTDHHPPMMAFLWRLYNFVWPGPGLMLATHLGLLCAAAYNFARAVEYVLPGRLWMLYLAIPLLPPVAAFSGFVLKDIGFTFSYLCAASVLARATMARQNLNFSQLVFILVLLFYGTAVKYQAIFVLPIMCHWVMANLRQYKPMWPQFLKAAVLFGLLWAAIDIFTAVTVKSKDHSWQLVKLYDLAGISLDVKENLFPDFTQHPDYFSMAAVELRYNTRRVDELALGATPIVIKGTTPEQRDALWWAWARNVVQHPLAYLEHRLAVWMNLISVSPFKAVNEISSQHNTVPGTMMAILLWMEKFSVLVMLKWLTSFKIYLPLLLGYLALGWRRRRESATAEALLMLNLMEATLLMALFVFSMASEARYIYLSVCCLHMSHPLAYILLRRKSA